MQEIQEVMPPSLDGDELGVAQTLYFENIGAIQNAILTANPDLFIGDGEGIVEKLEHRLHEYDGPNDDEGFLGWAVEATKADVEKFKFFYDLYREHRKSVLSGIWSVLRSCRDLTDHRQPGQTAREIAAFAWNWIFDHLDELAVPGTASMDTRLHAAARFIALTWRKSRLRWLARFPMGVEHLGRENTVEVDEGGNISDGGGPLFMEPDYEEDGDENPRQPPLRQVIRPCHEPSEVRGEARALCPKGCGLQSVRPDSKTELILACGHHRPRALPAN